MTKKREHDDPTRSSCEIHPSEDGRYIIARHRGELTSKLVLERTREAHALGEKLGIRLHLMDVTQARNVDPPVETYDFAYKDIQRYPGIDMRVRVAILASPEDHSHDFAETVARNAGHDVTLFRDRESAIRHLLRGAEDDRSVPDAR